MLKEKNYKDLRKGNRTSKEQKKGKRKKSQAEKTACVKV